MLVFITSQTWAAAKWQTFKFDEDITGSLAKLQQYCITHDVKLDDVLWANKINSVADITAGAEIFLPANQNDMLAIWQHQGAWQPKALVPVTSEAAAKRAANITSPQAPKVPETQVLPSPPSEKVPVVGAANLPDPPTPQTQAKDEEVDLGKLLESHRTAAQER